MEYLIRELENKLEHEFNDRGLLRRALVHPSYTAENRAVSSHNQRLEFFGDAVLQMAVTELLFFAHPDLQEGVLSKLRSALTNENALVGFAKTIDLGKYLQFGKGEEQSGGRERDSNLADAMEAVLGAMYQDGGMEVVKLFLQHHIGQVIHKPQAILKTENPKGALQEFAQQYYHQAPFYEVVNVNGPEHEPEFEVAVYIAGERIAGGISNSRKNAEKIAAAKALDKLTEHETQ